MTYDILLIAKIIYIEVRRKTVFLYAKINVADQSVHSDQQHIVLCYLDRTSLGT